MRALLVNPWVCDFKAFDFWNKPVGLLIVARILKSCGFEIDFIDCMDRLSPYFKTKTRSDQFGRGKYLFEEIEKPKIFKKIPRRYKRYGMPRDLFIEVLNRLKEPDLIFVTSSMTYWYLGVFEAIRILKEKFPTTNIILGGIYATLCEDHAVKNSGADTVLTGPAEDKLVKYLREKGYAGKNLDNQLTLDPDFSVYKNLNYGVVLLSRGCPFACSYCATYFLSPGFQTAPCESIVAQIEYFQSRTKNVAFFDDALLCNKTFPKILQAIINKKLRINLHSSNGLHCRFVDENIARLMLKANFKTIYLSLESTNPETQQNTGGKVSTDEFKKAVKIFYNIGFSKEAIHAYLLYGLPGQNYEEIIDSIRLCRSLGVNPHICEFTPIPHTAEFSKTGFDENTDPLYHNNLFYTWYYPEEKSEIYRKIKNL